MKLCFLGTGTAGSKLMPEGTVPEGKRRCCSMFIDGDVVVTTDGTEYSVAVRNAPHDAEKILISGNGVKV